MTFSTAIEPISPDPGGDTFIACALAKAEFLVTGNKRHYRQLWALETRLVNAGELIQAITNAI